MKKICHITTTSQHFIPRIIRESHTAQKMGLHVYIVSQGETFIKDEIEFIGVQESKNRAERMLIVSKNLYKEALSIDADIYQIHDPELLPYALKLRAKGKKVIFDSHENYTMQITEKKYLPKCVRGIISKLYNIYEGHVCKKIDSVIIPCTFEGKNVFENRSKKSYIISNAVEADFYSNVSNKEKVDNKICYIGALTYNRGIYHLIKAAYRAKVTLILAGDFSDNNFRSQLENMEEYKCVDYRGFVTKSEIADICNECKIGISTLLNVGQYKRLDNLPTKVYEYMALGLPVIISNYPYATKLNNEYNFGITVNPDNIEEIADAISCLTKDTQLSNKIGENGKRLITSKLNWQIEEKKLIELYESLIQ